MTRFNLDAVEREVSRERYVFEAEGRAFSLPHVADLTLGQSYGLDSQQYVPVFRDVATFADDDPGPGENGPDVPAGDLLAGILLDKTPAQASALVAGWLAHGGHKPGESAASSTT